MESVLKSDYLLYYIALIIGFVGFVMCVIFIPFKSVATLMMMMSGIAVVLFAMLLLVVALLLDAKDGKFTF